METLNRQETSHQFVPSISVSGEISGIRKIIIINLKKTRYAYRIYLTLRDSLDAGVAVAESDLGVLYS